MKQFIEDCRYLGRSLGVKDKGELLKQSVAGNLYERHDALFYRTGTFLIGVCPISLNMVVVKLKNNNTVLLTDGLGTVIRYHGEATDLVVDINAALIHLAKFGREAFSV